MSGAEGHRPWNVAAAGAALLALLLPVSTLAAVIAGQGGFAGPEVPRGIWALKGALLLFAAGLVFLGRSGPGREAEPRGFVTLDGNGAGPLLLLILLVGLILRLVELGSGLWLDEIFTLLDYVRKPVLVVGTTFQSDNNHLLYSVLARSSVLAFGESAWSLRLPAVLLGVVSLWAAHGFVSRVGTRNEALLVAGALALSFHHVWFSQNARGYTGLLLFTLLSSSAFIDLLEGTRKDPRRVVLAYSLAAGLGIYMHLTALFAVAAHGLVWLWILFRPGAREIRWPFFGLVGAGLVTLVLYAPVLPQMFTTLTGWNGVIGAAEWQGLGWMLREMAGGLARGLPGGWLGLAAGSAVALAGCVSLFRDRPAAFSIMCLPGLVGTVTFLAMSRNLWPRFYFFLAGFAILIVVRGVLTLSRGLGGARGGRLATAGLALAILGSGFIVPRAWGPKQDFEGAAEFVAERSGPRAGVGVVGLAAYPFQAYYGQPWPKLISVEDLEALEGEHDTTRVVFVFPGQVASAEPEIWARLTSDYLEEGRFPGTVAGGDVLVFSRR